LGFHDRLDAAWASSGSMLCVGLDPDPAKFPAPLDGAPDALEHFCIAIIDATADLVCAFKPQIAHFASQRAEPQLEVICTYIRERYPDVVLVLDAKRGDIASTAEHYAREAFGRYGADAVTVNPYLGTDAAAPFLGHGGVLALCRTSNAGSADVQDLVVTTTGGEPAPLYQRVARMVAEEWSMLGECGLVVGATFPQQLEAVRGIAGDLPILVPGVGAQGGDVEASVRAGATGPGTGLIMSSSRAILYASSGDDFAATARSVALTTRDAIVGAGAASAGRGAKQ
jgi:orotidine-5'-phosphate decarboxylase